MPPRSVKMKRRIFGFQRRVWWPKCTPASRSSRMETTATGGAPSWVRFGEAGGAGAEPTSGAGTPARQRPAGSSIFGRGIVAAPHAPSGGVAILVVSLDDEEVIERSA